MIFVFGAILQSIRVAKDSDHTAGNVQYAIHYHNSVGGKGAMQALAAAKSEAKTALVGRTGDDELAKHILLRLRTHGVITSGVAKAEKVQTGTSIRIENDNQTILALGASSRTKAEQLPIEALNPDSIVLLQTELPKEENSKVLSTAKEASATTIIDLSPQANLSEEDWANIDYVIAPEKRKDYVASNAKDTPISAIYLKTDGNLEMSIKGGPIKTVPKPALEALTWKHPEGSDDTFCGTFAASLYGGLSLNEAITRAHVAASLTATIPGIYDAIPYSEAVNECIKALKSQEKV